MTGRRHLLMAVHNRSWGRAEMAVRVAEELRAAGDHPHFLLHTSMVPLAQEAGFEIQPVADHLGGGLVRLALDTMVHHVVRPESLIFFDYFNTCNYLLSLGTQDLSYLLEYPCTIASLDTWDAALTGTHFDLFGEPGGNLARGDTEARAEAFERIEHRLIPVPMAAIDDRPGKFACLPDLSPTGSFATGEREAGWRQRLDIPDGHRAVLFCSSEWQRVRGDHKAGQRLARLLPLLMGVYVDQLGPSVHLVHVGPHRYPLQPVLGERYHWRSPLGRREFERLMAASDLLLTANVSATTIGWAIQLGVPVVVLENSRMLGGIDDVESLTGGLLSEAASQLWREALPVYPFRLWPLGYYDFLQPLLAENAYCRGFETVELADEPGVVATCRALLFDPVAREGLAARQRHYVEQAQGLPSAAEVIHGFLA